jgi:long-chain acyl-CoA synthetase
MEETMNESLGTLPRLLLHQAQVRGERPAIREKHLGVWQVWTWRQVADEVRALACGLAANGFERGMHLAIIGDNRPRLYFAMLAAQVLGGVPVPMYQDAPMAELAYVLNDGEIVYAVAEDQEQVDKLVETRERVPSLQHILFDDPRGLRHYQHLRSLDEIQEQGRAFDREHPGFFERELAAGQTTDTAIILYTSGTTGKPKGVCQTHSAFLTVGHAGCAFDHLGPEERVLCYLPMAWVGDHVFSYTQWLVAGFTINCPESGATVTTDLREIGPTYYFAPPRVFENLLTQVTIRMDDACALKQWMFRQSMAVAARCGADLLDGRKVPLLDRIKYRLGDLLVYAPLRDVLGFSRLRVAYTAGAAISPDLFRFYRSIGINLKQFYGSTETCAYICLQSDGDVKLDTVGKPAPGVELKIAANSEVLVRGPMLLEEYYKRPDATAESFDAEGYFHTGDAGYLDADGHLKIVDRAKDVGKLASGALFAPNYIENKLKFSPHVKEAVAFGHDREGVCVLLNIDMSSVGNWAERGGIAYAGYADLAQKPEVYGLLREYIERVNHELAEDPALSASQVHRYLVLHKELDPDDDELTRTRKVRRGFIAEKYAVLIDALYGGKAVQHIETLVRFEDGRTGMVAADLRIDDVKTFPTAEMRKAA